MDALDLRADDQGRDEKKSDDTSQDPASPVVPVAVANAPGAAAVVAVLAAPKILTTEDVGRIHGV